MTRPGTSYVQNPNAPAIDKKAIMEKMGSLQNNLSEGNNEQAEKWADEILGVLPKP